MTTLFLVGALVIGLITGSFLNVVIHRLPVMLERQWRRDCAELTGQTPPDEPPFDLVRPPSHCPSCQRPVRAFENIPLLSYLFLRGRCAGCGTRISLRYPVVELLTGLLAALVAGILGPTPWAAWAMLLTFALVALAFIDYDHQLLPDDITLPLLWLGLVLAVFGIGSEDADARILGAAAGYGSLWLIYQAFRLTTGKEGMGFGDFKLLAVFGAWLGWKALLPIVLLASVAGAIVGLSLIAFAGRDRARPIPFGPYLAIAGWIELLWGSEIERVWFSGIL